MTKARACTQVLHATSHCLTRRRGATGNLPCQTRYAVTAALAAAQHAADLAIHAFIESGVAERYSHEYGEGADLLAAMSVEVEVPIPGLTAQPDPIPVAPQAYFVQPPASSAGSHPQSGPPGRRPSHP